MNIYRFVPILLAVIVVVGFTLQNTEDNVQLSEKCRMKIASVLEDRGYEVNYVWWNTAGHFRKLAHVGEYFFFGVAIYIAVQKIWVCCLLSVGMSFLDQIVKVYVPIRHFDITDIPFDMIGWISGVVVCWLIVSCVRWERHT